jgi:D-xylose transport system ATP-binding protein
MVAELIQELKKQGLGIFLISHDTREMMELCDRVAVMKNGQMVGTERVEDVTEDDILSMIILGKNPREAA